MTTLHPESPILQSGDERNIKLKKTRNPLPLSLGVTGFTLAEVMVAVGVFALIAVAAGGVFVSMQNAWQRQRQDIDLVQNARWAMEFMANEIRQGINFTDNIPGGIPRGRGLMITYPGGNRSCFWRGDAVSDATRFGDTSYLYQGAGNNINQAYGQPSDIRQQLANFLVDNPDIVNNGTGNPAPDGASDPLFLVQGNLITMELTVRPTPSLPAGQGNPDYTLRTKVRGRN